MKTLLRSAILALLVLGTLAGVSATKTGATHGPTGAPFPDCPFGCGGN